MDYRRWWCKHIRGIRTLGLWPLVPQTERLSQEVWSSAVAQYSPSICFYYPLCWFCDLLDQWLDGSWVDCLHVQPSVPTPFIGASNHRSWKVSVVTSTQALSCWGRTRASPGGLDPFSTYEQNLNLNQATRIWKSYVRTSCNPCIVLNGPHSFAVLEKFLSCSNLCNILYLQDFIKQLNPKCRKVRSTGQPTLSWNVK